MDKIDIRIAIDLVGAVFNRVGTGTDTGDKILADFYYRTFSVTERAVLALTALIFDYLRENDDFSHVKADRREEDPSYDGVEDWCSIGDRFEDAVEKLLPDMFDFSHLRE